MIHLGVIVVITVAIKLPIFQAHMIVTKRNNNMMVKQIERKKSPTVRYKNFNLKGHDKISESLKALMKHSPNCEG